MTPAAVTDSLLHQLVTSSRAEGTGRLAVAAAITLDDPRPALRPHHARLRPGMGPAQRAGAARRDPRRRPGPHPGLRLRAGHRGDSRYLGSHGRMHDGETTRTFVFTATCADPHWVRQHAQIAHCWAEPASLPDKISQDLAHLAGLAAHATAGTNPSAPGQWQLATALRACSKGIYCGEAATELIINHRTWLRRDDFTTQFILTTPRQPTTSPQRSTGKQPSPPWTPATFPAPAARPPCSAWPPASPPAHPSA